MQFGHTTIRWDALNIILFVAACFAIGSIGFFTAVFFESTTHQAASASQELTTQRKYQAIQSLVASEQVSNASSSASGSQTLPASGVAPSQADVNDKSAAEKLNILNSLNSQ